MITASKVDMMSVDLRFRSGALLDAEVSAEDELSATSTRTLAEAQIPHTDHDNDNNLTLLQLEIPKKSTNVSQDALLPKPSTLTRKHDTQPPPIQPENGSMARQAGRDVRLVRPTAPTTPHTIRALQYQHATTATSKRNRKRSINPVRETPRDAMRHLSRVLAPMTRLIAPSPLLPQSIANRRSYTNVDYELEEDGAANIPRFSLPIHDENDDESFEATPPRLSLPFEDGLLSSRSVERARHVHSMQPAGRYSGDSLGVSRFSDRFADLDDSNHNTPRNSQSEEHWHSSTLPRQVSDALEEIEHPLRTSTQIFRKDRIQDGGFPPFILPDHPLQSSPIEEAQGPFAFDVPPLPANTPSQIIDKPQDESLTWSRGLPAGIGNKNGMPSGVQKSKAVRLKNTQLSRHGIAFSPLPAMVVKKVASRFEESPKGKKANIKLDTLEAIMEASNQFFDQLGMDLQAYAQHASRKKIDETDITTIMKRQRRLAATKTSFSLAQKYLPRELLQDVRMWSRGKRGRRRVFH